MEIHRPNPLLSGRRLVFPALFLTVLELLLAAFSLVLFELDRIFVAPVLLVTLSAYVLASVVWAAWQAIWLRPILSLKKALSEHGGSRASTDHVVVMDKVRVRASSALFRFPDLAVAARCLIALVAATGACISGLHFVRMSGTECLALMSLFLCTAFAVSIFRRIWLSSHAEQLLRNVLGQDPFDHPRSGRRLLGRLFWTSMACGGLGLISVFMFTRLIIAPPRITMLLLITYLPITLGLLSFAWLFAAMRFFRPVARYLASGASERESMASVAFRSAQALPYILAASKAFCWLIGGLLLLFQAVRFFGMDTENALLILVAAFIVMLAAVLYEALWHRRTLRPLLSELLNRHRLPLGQVRSPVSLRIKMLFGFGVLAVFSCAAAIFWSFVQYRNLATDFIRKEARLRTDLIVDKLKTQDQIQRGIRREDITGLLRDLASGQQAVYYHLPPAGPIFAAGAGSSRPPSLPFIARTRMRRHRRGLLVISEHNLTGAFEQIWIGSRYHGAVAVLYPDYRGRGPGIVRHFKLLIVFFFVLLLMTGGIVILIVADLTGPLRSLEQRVEEMARGDLQRPVPGGGEVDEVGRLTFAFEGMRRSLDEKLTTIQALNLGLENKVKARTADLARANTELRNALNTLTQTKDQLVRSEKLASIGQLVAGVAHELNNPINAVVNSIGPLEQALSDLLDDLDPDSEGAGAAKELADEIRQILRVIASGTSRTQKIVSALSSYSRTDSELFLPTDLNHALDQALQITAHLTSSQKVEKEYGKDVRVVGRPGQLEQVFVNLLANAAQALGVRNDGRIRIRTCSSDKEAMVTISDNGPGISETHLPRIFDPFFTTKEVGQGTGLGLSICHEIVTRHGGRIEVESRPGHGASFTIVLPLEQPATEPGTDSTSLIEGQGDLPS